MTTRHLIVGIDGADLRLINQFGKETLPTLHQLIADGAYCYLQSVIPPATLPNWTTFLTGQDPGQHGVFDFTTRHGYGIKFSGGTVRRSSLWIEQLDEDEKKCACVGFPATWPPPKLQHGIFISGWDSPVAFESDVSFVWPTSLHGEIVERFGAQRFDDVNEFATDKKDWHRRLPFRLAQRIERKCELGQWLMNKQSWDVFALYFGESDTASHHLWNLHDPRSPRRPKEVDPVEEQGLLRVYMSIDAALTQLIKAADPVEITIVSDHGFGGSSDKVLFINRALAQAGLLRFRQDAALRSAMGSIRQWAMRLTPPAVKQSIFRAAKGNVANWLESQNRFASIDFRNTVAFSEELNYFPSVHLNLRGREPKGVVPTSCVSEVTQKVTDALMRVRDPLTNRPVIRKVWHRDELYHGPATETAPDLLLELELDQGYSYNLMPSMRPGPTWTVLKPSQYMGRKGRSLAGSHRDRGLFIAHGPSIENAGKVELGMQEAARWTMKRCGLSVTDNENSVDSPGSERQRQSQAAKVASRLRALGYVD